MPSTHLALHYHLVFSTKDRRPLLAAEGASRVHEYLGGAIREMGGIAHAVGGMPDHVHVLASLRATHRLADIMRELKSESSGWIHRELGRSMFQWQEGYGAFTVSAPQIEMVRRYVLKQEEHHRTKSFQMEYTRLLERSGVEFDEKYLW